MAKPTYANKNTISLHDILGDLNPKQDEFVESKTLYTAYGGAKGGGKTHGIRWKAIAGAFRWENIKILIIRRTYPELQKNHIEPLLKTIMPFIKAGVAKYNGQMHTVYFQNGATIHFGHYQGAAAEQEYAGVEYDWIFMDEATQFLEEEFRYLGGCLRGVNEIPKRFYLTCNPGGVGHRWVKRLFIDKNYKCDSENWEENENPDDYTFIFAKIEDNVAMRDRAPQAYEQYLKMLSSLPVNIRDAYRNGNWDILGGNYFPEFGEPHIIRKNANGKYDIPGFESFVRYRAIDYGFDMLASLWIAIDHAGRCYVYREFNQGKDNAQRELLASEAAGEIKSHTPANENIVITFAPPDLWNRKSTDGKSSAEEIMVNGVGLVRSNNDRTQGGMQVKELLNTAPDGKPWLMVLDCCPDLIAHITDIQSDPKDPNKYSTEPHKITHNVDALRYFCISRTLPTEMAKEIEQQDEDDEEEYDDFMTGGAITTSYVTYGG